MKHIIQKYVGIFCFLYMAGIFLPAKAQEVSPHIFDPQTPVSYPKLPGNLLNESRTPLRLPIVDGYQILKCDFHMHTVFSDGSVWPTTRVEEAFREGLDAMAITEHLEFHHLNAPDVNAKNLNREYEIARETADRLGILLIPGAEVTREVPAGHFNILFVKDANQLERYINYKNRYDPSNLVETLQAAKEQGGFIFWNHPSYKHPRSEAEWFDIHEKLYRKGLIEGIEVANSNMYIPLVQQWAEEKKLTMLSNSDYHHSVSMPEGCHRPMTLVFARERSTEGIREALESRHTVAFAQNYLYGPYELTEPLFQASLKTRVLHVDSVQTVVEINNMSGLNFDLNFQENRFYTPAIRNIILFGGKTIAVTLRNKRNIPSASPKCSQRQFKVNVANIVPSAGKILETSIGFSLPEIEDSSVSVLKDKQGWDIDSIAPGMIHYHYGGWHEPMKSFQNVNVMEVDLTGKGYNVKLTYEENADSLSAVAESHHAVAGINGTYEPDGSYVKIDGKFYARNTLKKDDLRYWKHEGAFFYDEKEKAAKICFATDSVFERSSFPDIISGAPMLIDNYDPVGLRFTGDISGLCLDSLEYEDYRRHQGVRHPRTAVALTKGGSKLLLITVDGRRPQTAGMSARELTQFLIRYFDLQSALNIDGGGSTTMWVSKPDGIGGEVLNYPTDNKKYDHYGQRRVSSFLLIMKLLLSGKTF